MIAAAWEVIWWKKDKANDQVAGLLQFNAKQAEEQRGGEDVRARIVDRVTAARLAGMLSSWCPISQVVVKGSPLDHFAIRLEQDTIAFTEATRFFVQAKDVNDQDIELDSKTFLNLLVVTNEEYGTFIDKQGDTLKTVPVKLEDIPYGDAKDGLIRFAAVKKNPISLEGCRMRAELQSDATKKGEKDATVLEQTLKIVMTAPYEVQPVITPATVERPSTENRKEFTIRLTRGGKPVANHPFRLTTNYLDGSGGHDHVDPRRAENRENYGHFILRRTGGHQNRPYDGQTQANGREEFDYVASIFGDRTRIRVDSRRDPLLWDTSSVAEKVPDLRLLGGGANYVKVGGTCEHHASSDRGASKNCQTQDHNHWGTATLVRVVQAVADSFSTTYPGYRLRVNDMSLPNGGKFEFDGSWSATADHQEHRKGTNADVALTAYNATGREDGLNQRQRTRLWDLISHLAGRRPLNESDRNHYHIQ